MANTVNIKDLQPSYVFQVDTKEHKEDILNQAKEDNKDACWIGYGIGDINSQYQPSPIKEDDYYMKYCNSDNYDYLKDYRLVWGYSIGIIEEDVIINTDTGEHLAEGDNCTTYTPPSNINYKKGKWLRFSGIYNLNPKTIQNVYLPDYIISFKGLCKNLQSINVIENLDTSNIYNMDEAFYNVKSINNTNKLILDFANVKSAVNCFYHTEINNECIDFINCSGNCNYTSMFQYSRIKYLPTGINKQDIGGENMFFLANFQGDITFNMKLYRQMFYGADFDTISGHFICDEDINSAFDSGTCNNFNVSIDFTNVINADEAISIKINNPFTIDLSTLPENSSYNCIITLYNEVTIIPASFIHKQPIIKLNDYRGTNYKINITKPIKYYTIYDDEFTSSCYLIKCFDEIKTINLNINVDIETTLLIHGYVALSNLTGNLIIHDNIPNDISYNEFKKLVGKNPGVNIDLSNFNIVNHDNYHTPSIIGIVNIDATNKNICIFDSNRRTINTNSEHNVYILYIGQGNNETVNIINNDSSANIVYLYIPTYTINPNFINATNSNIIAERISTDNSNTAIKIQNCKQVTLNGEINYLYIYENIDTIKYNYDLQVYSKVNKKYTIVSESFLYGAPIFYPIRLVQFGDNNALMGACEFPNFKHENSDNYFIITDNFYINFDVSYLSKFATKYYDTLRNGINSFMWFTTNQVYYYSNKYNSSIKPIEEETYINMTNYGNLNSSSFDLVCNGDYTNAIIDNIKTRINIYGEYGDENGENITNCIPKEISCYGLYKIYPGNSINLVYNNINPYSQTINILWNKIGVENYTFKYQSIKVTSLTYQDFGIIIRNVENLVHLDLTEAKIGKFLTLYYVENLDDESIDNIINADYEPNTEITLSFKIYNKLTDEQKQVILDKNCTLISYKYE